MGQQSRSSHLRAVKRDIQLTLGIRSGSAAPEDDRVPIFTPKAANAILCALMANDILWRSVCQTPGRRCQCVQRRKCVNSLLEVLFFSCVPHHGCSNLADACISMVSHARAGSGRPPRRVRCPQTLPLRCSGKNSANGKPSRSSMSFVFARLRPT